MRAVILALALLLAGQASCAPISDPMMAYAMPQRLVKLPDGRRMNLYCTGENGPVVILDAGFGGSTFSWGTLQPKLSGFRACSYDRAGMGFSDPGPLPRDVTHRAADLAALLKASGLPGPYILVGHSLGGLDVRLFAFQHPKDVAGLVLVDPSVEHQEDRIAALLGVPRPPLAGGPKACLAATEAGLKLGTPEYDRCAGKYPDRWPQGLKDAFVAQRSKPDYFRTEVSELESLADADGAQIDAARRALGDIPLIVLTAENTYRAGAPEAVADALSTLWMSMHDDLARESTRGENRLVRGSGHLIQNDNPVAVAAAIREVAALAGKR